MTPFPFSDQNPVEHGGDLPDAVDVAIIGGGIIGVMSAYYLAQKGLRVLVLEKGRVAAEQSSRNWGWVRQQNRDHAELPIMVEANRLWRGLDMQTNNRLGLARCGLTYLAESDADTSNYDDWLKLAHAHDVDSCILSSTEVAKMFSGAIHQYAGALHTPSDMRAEPWKAVPVLARLAVEHGVMIREGCAVRALDIVAGRVCGVVTEQGVVRADAVVVAGGAWSNLFLRQYGVDIHQLSVGASVVATEPCPEVYAGGASMRNLAFRRREDGGYTIAASGFHQVWVGRDAFRSFGKYIPQLRDDPFGRQYFPAAPKGFPDAWGTARHWSADDVSPFEKMRVLNPAPHLGRLRKAADKFTQHFPQVGQIKFRTAWAGMIDATPDTVPVVDHIAALPGLSVCTGMCGHGFGIGPAFGRIMADLVAGDDVGHDLSRFRAGRFSDGSKLELGPGL